VVKGGSGPLPRTIRTCFYVIGTLAGTVFTIADAKTGVIGPPDPRMSTALFDPNDPLVSSQDLIQSAAEVLSELRNGLLGETPPAK
jgi:hypothetical protein